jgi:hypothetical protein
MNGSELGEQFPLSCRCVKRRARFVLVPEDIFGGERSQPLQSLPVRKCSTLSKLVARELLYLVSPSKLVTLSFELQGSQ